MTGRRVDLMRTLAEAVEDGRMEGTTCEFVGHEWEDAGGGLLTCLVCEAEKWAADASTETHDHPPTAGEPRKRGSHD